MESKSSSSPISLQSQRFAKSSLTSKSPFSAKELGVKKKGFSKGLRRDNGQEIQEKLDDELTRIKFHPECNKQERYMVHKLAFDQLVEQGLTIDCKHRTSIYLGTQKSWVQSQFPSSICTDLVVASLWFGQTRNKCPWLLKIYIYG